VEQVAALGDQTELKEIEEAFAQFRSESDVRRPYPLPLRRKAVEMARRIESNERVAAACGVSKQTVRNWVVAIPPPARRLSVATSEGEIRGNGCAESEPGEVVEREIGGVSRACAEEEGAIISSFLFRLGAGVSLEASPSQTLWLLRNLGGRE
jgi:hypothetical protein